MSDIKVYKFGGASVKDATSVKNISNIIKADKSKKLIVVSAMGKTTNALEVLAQKAFSKENFNVDFDRIKAFHFEILTSLFPHDNLIFSSIEALFDDLWQQLQQTDHSTYNAYYDSIVGYGEIISTKIIAAFIKTESLSGHWLDARNYVKTDDFHQNANINWSNTEKLIEKDIRPLFKVNDFIITQGFIGSFNERMTTLGREGSDFSGAIFAYCLNAKSLTIWKDVAGVLNADPKWFDDTQLLNHISYNEAIELAYYGATIIHPKTIKPLQNKQIPLLVRSFINPEEGGTVIDSNSKDDTSIPSFIFKINQILISISPRDFSFIAESNLSSIYKTFADLNIRINLMQNSAINFSVCTDYDERKITELIKKLKTDYKVLFNKNVELATIRHYDTATINRVMENKSVLLEQKSRVTARMVMKEE